MSNVIPTKEELTLVCLLVIVLTAGFLTYMGKVSGDNFMTLATAVIAVFAAVLGVKVATARQGT